MSISSMTGFARADGQDGACAWTWEVKSVNARGLDVRCRLPGGYDRLEPPARERAQARFQRGSVTIGLKVTQGPGEGGYRINEAALGELLAALPEIRERVPDAGPPSVDGLLALRGVIEPAEDELGDEARDAFDAAILEDLDRALDAVAAMRGEEGARLAPALTQRLDDIGRLCGEAEKLAAAQPEAIHARLKTQIEEVLAEVPALPEDRLAQEVAVLAGKADLREELDRLKAHREAAQALIGTDGAIGRKLDFLCQEFNREANTLCSKSQDIELTRVGLELKSVIEQFREQVQNIE